MFSDFGNLIINFWELEYTLTLIFPGAIVASNIVSFLECAPIFFLPCKRRNDSVLVPVSSSSGLGKAAGPSQTRFSFL